MTEEGTVVALLNGKGEIHSSSWVDYRPVVAVYGVTAAVSATTGATLRVLAGDDIVEMSGNRITTLCQGVSEVFRGENPRELTIGYNAKYDETVISSVHGGIARRQSDGQWVRYSVPRLSTGGAVRLLQGTQGRLLAVNSLGVWNLSEEKPEGTMNVWMRQSGRAAKDVGGWMVLDVNGSEVDGTVKVSGHRGTGVAEPLLSVDISGPVNAPIVMRMASPERRYLVRELSVRGSADMWVREF